MSGSEWWKKGSLLTALIDNEKAYRKGSLTLLALANLYLARNGSSPVQLTALTDGTPSFSPTWLPTR